MAFLLAKQNGAWQESQMGLQAPHSQNPTPLKTTWVNYSCNVAGSQCKRDRKGPFL